MQPEENALHDVDLFVKVRKSERLVIVVLSLEDHRLCCMKSLNVPASGCMSVIINV